MSKKLKLHFGYILFIGMEVKSKFSLPFLHSLKLRKEELVNEVNSKNGGNFRLNYKGRKGN